jgi:hypothetical protein
MAGAVEPLSHRRLCRVGDFLAIEDILPGSGKVFDALSPQSIHYVLTIRVKMAEEMAGGHVFTMAASDLLQLGVLL